MKQPYLHDDAFLNDVARSRDETQGYRLWWMGQSGFLLQWKGRHLLLDPYLSDSLTEKYADTEKPHVRMTARVVAPDRLDFVDVVTSTHNHTDHLDAETILPIRRANMQLELVIPEANRVFVADRLGTDPTWPRSVDVNTGCEVAGFRFTGIPAAHNDLDKDERGYHRYLGYIVRFGRWTLYHSGDTLWYEGLEEQLVPYDVDVALLPINGHDPARDVPGNLDGREAAELAKAIGAKLVIPCHFDMFTFNTASPDAFVDACERLGQPYHVLRNGEGMALPV